MEQENLEVPTENVDEVVSNQNPEPSKYERLALEQGWRPKEEWDGDPDDWRPAKEFVERGELFQKISSQNNEIKEMRKALSALADHHRKVKETEFTRAIQYLREQKKLALENGDADKIVEVDEAISELKEQSKALKDEPKADIPQAPHPRFVQFVQQNAWYNTDAELRNYANEIGVGKKATEPDIDPDTLFKYVEKMVKKHFPEKFKRPSVPMVEGGSVNGSSKGSTKEFTLTEEERRTMNTFVRQGIMTKEEYIKELKAVKGE